MGRNIHTHAHTYIHKQYITALNRACFLSVPRKHAAFSASCFLRARCKQKQTAAAAGAPAKASAWARFHAKINHAADGFYYRLGYWVAKHTKLTVLASIVFVILCSAGFANFSTETSGEPRRGSRLCSS